MQSFRSVIIVTLVLSIFSACGPGKEKKKEVNIGKGDTISTKTAQQLELPAPYATKSVQNYCDVIGWPQNKTPIAPDRFSITEFADSLNNPRWIYVNPNGDIFVAESTKEVGGIKEIKNKISGKSESGNSSKSANRITLFRDINHDGVPDMRSIFLTGLDRPFGMLVLNNRFFVGNTGSVVAYHYQSGQTKITARGKKILSLPVGGYNNHWTRNLLAGKDGKKIFVTVGSGSNAGEHGMDNEIRRADILEINPDGTGERIYASGLRNPQGMGFAPGTNTLWVSVNERDGLGDELVPDYLTSVKEGGFYGWPYSYWGQHEDPRLKDKQRPDMVQKAIVPDVPLGAHTASLGLAFDENEIMSGQYKGGAFIG